MYHKFRLSIIFSIFFFAFLFVFSFSFFRMNWLLWRGKDLQANVYNTALSHAKNGQYQEAATILGTLDETAFSGNLFSDRFSELE